MKHLTVNRHEQIMVIWGIQYRSNVSYHLFERRVSLLSSLETHLISLETRLVSFESFLVSLECTASTSALHFNTKSQRSNSNLCFRFAFYVVRLRNDHRLIAYQSFRTHGRFVPRRFVPRLGRFVPNFQSVHTQPSGRFVPNKL